MRRRKEAGFVRQVCSGDAGLALHDAITDIAVDKLTAAAIEGNLYANRSVLEWVIECKWVW